MAGILDEVMDGIAAKEKQEGKESTPAQQQEQTATPEQTQTQQTTDKEKAMNTYGDEFKEKYGEKNKNT